MLINIITSKRSTFRQIILQFDDLFVFNRATNLILIAQNRINFKSSSDLDTFGYKLFNKR